MRKIVSIIVALALLSLTFQLAPKTSVFADTKNFCDNTPTVKVDPNNFNTTITIDTKSQTLPAGLVGADVEFRANTGTETKIVKAKVAADGTITGEFGKILPGTHEWSIWRYGTSLCIRTFTVSDLNQGGATTGNNIIFTPPSPKANDPITAKVENLVDGDYFYSIVVGTGEGQRKYGCGTSSSKTFTFTIPALESGEASVTVMHKNANQCSGEGSAIASGRIIISAAPPPDELRDTAGDETIPDAPLPCGGPLVNGMCPFLKTAIGDISTDPAKFVQIIFKLVLGLSGGIALILIIISGYKFMASSGNPEATKSAGEGLTSAVIGLLFIIFAFVILQIVGVDILRIPGFSK